MAENLQMRTKQIMLMISQEEWDEQQARLKRIEELLEDQKNKSSVQEQWLTTREAAERLGIATRTLQDYRNRRCIPFSQICKTIRYKASDIDQFLEEHYIKKNKLEDYKNRNNRNQETIKRSVIQ